MRKSPSQEEVRRQNLGALLRYVHRHGAMSRAELTSRLGLNRSTIGALTADLGAAGLVTEAAPRETGRAGRAGRPSLVVSPRSETVCAYALSIEVDQVRAARVGLGGVVLDRRQAAREPGQPGEAAVALAASFVAQMQAAAPTGVRNIGSGVAIGRRVRAADGTIRLGPPAGSADEPLLGLEDDPVRAALAEVLPGDRPVTIGAAADVAALAEHARGAAAGYDNVIYLYGDAGISAGIIAGGRSVSGFGGIPGEVGHTVVHPAGRPCRCGSRGCWETEVGEYALLRAAGRTAVHPAGLPPGVTGRQAVRAVVDAAQRGDAGAQAAVRQVGEWLGVGVGNLVNIFNPEMVIFGEALRDIYLAAAAPLRSRLNSIGLASSLRHVRLRTPALGDDAVLVGAAELAFDELLADPLDPAPR
jgi:predicted NBD/HSP70 family sugar kinase